MAKITVHKDKDWNLHDYKALYELIESMSVDVEGMAFAASDEVQNMSDKAEKGFKDRDYYLKCLSYVADMIDIINDVPAAQVRAAE